MHEPTMSPWMPEQDPLILRRVGKTGEEAAELLKAANRIVIQGIDGVDPETGKTNRQSLLEELADVIAQCEVTREMLFQEESLAEFVAQRIARKKSQMAEWESLVEERTRAK